MSEAKISGFTVYTTTLQPEFLKIFTLAGVSKKFGFSDRILCLRVDEQPSGFENTRVHVDSVTQFCCIDGGIQYSG